jgi:LDH2 family malate/lactate/ureidoglycolate dehydrogenase
MTREKLRAMLEADLIGADAHGVFRLMQYVHRLKLGSTNPRPNITVNRTAPATALVDGDNGMGHLVVARAAETAIELARECGVACRVGCHVRSRWRGGLCRVAVEGRHGGSLFGCRECQPHAARRR